MTVMLGDFIDTDIS